MADCSGRLALFKLLGDKQIRQEISEGRRRLSALPDWVREVVERHILACELSPKPTAAELMLASYFVSHRETRWAIWRELELTLSQAPKAKGVRRQLAEWWETGTSTMHYALGAGYRERHKVRRALRNLRKAVEIRT